MLFIHLPDDEHLDCFQPLDIMKNATFLNPSNECFVLVNVFFNFRISICFCFYNFYIFNWYFLFEESLLSYFFLFLNMIYLFLLACL